MGRAPKGKHQLFGAMFVSRRVIHVWMQYSKVVSTHTDIAHRFRNPLADYESERNPSLDSLAFR